MQRERFEKLLKKTKKNNSVLPEQSGTEAFIKPSNALFPE